MIHTIALDRKTYGGERCAFDAIFDFNSIYFIQFDLLSNDPLSCVCMCVCVCVCWCDVCACMLALCACMLCMG